MWRPEWSPLEVALRAALVYLFVIVVFRLAGRKELGRFSTFDVALVFLITVALRRSMTGDDKSLTNAFVALGTLVVLDRTLTWLTWRSRRLADWIQGPARLLVEDGRLRPRELRRTRISEEELRAGLRRHGHESLEDVRRAYLERDGQLSFVLRSKEHEREKRA
jgi:uncharacterized membrane protein YcaP (DUF421 family)